jgi:hypothetical protein
VRASRRIDKVIYSMFVNVSKVSRKGEATINTECTIAILEAWSVVVTTVMLFVAAML